MTPFQGYLAALIVLVAGIALSVFGWLCRQSEAVQLGGMMIGAALGWIGLKRPVDQ